MSEIAKVAPTSQELAVAFGDLGDNAEGGNTRVPSVRYRSPRTGANDKTGEVVPALIAAGIKPYKFYLYDGEPIGIEPFHVHVFKVDRFSILKKGMKTLRIDPGIVTQAMKDEDNDPDEKVSWVNRVVALLGVVLPGEKGIIPAVGSFDSGLGQAFDGVKSTFAQAQDPTKWAARSPRHVIAAKAVWPSGRFRLALWGEGKPYGDGEFQIGKSQTIAAIPEQGVANFNKFADPTTPEYATLAIAAAGFDAAKKWNREFNTRSDFKAEEFADGEDS